MTASAASESSRKNQTLAILGGGMTGLATAYYAAQRALPFDLYEALSEPGGNCRTFQHGEFRFDSGAHRFHDRDPEITREAQALLGDRLQQITLPSKVFTQNQWLEFPLRAGEVFRNLGLWRALRAAWEVGSARVRRPPVASFQDFALRTYGRTIAEKFLLNYSEKLWGESCDRLSPAIAGRRLQGLDVRELLRRLLPGHNRRARHVEGTFYYPEGGIQALSEALRQQAGDDRIHCAAEITRLEHANSRIHSLEINQGEKVPVDFLVSTLPLDRLLTRLSPAPPDNVLKAARRLHYRHLRLAAFFINQPSIMRAATLYFPDKEFSFTRLYEPKNRNPRMAPADQTSLVAETPCSQADALWGLTDEAFLDTIQEQILRTGLFKPQDLLGRTPVRLGEAYPILTLEAGQAREEVLAYLDQFENLHPAGRNGRYEYAWIHDMFRFGQAAAHAAGAYFSSARGVA